ncbi:MAG TPA: Flp pilus assembly protein CpaB [Burkholderiaceae bacterium]|nr:Flp pilus assembly protein CpaB [Burkholderiaceae bacterium]
MKLSLHRSWLILGAALAIGGLAAFGVNRYIVRQVQEVEARGKAVKTVRIVVPKEDLQKGSALEAPLVAVREVPQEWAQSNAVTPDQFARVEHQKLAYGVRRGEMILWSMLEGQRAPTFSSRLAKGRRAITVPVDEVNSISGMLEPGDRIDLMTSIRRDNQTYMFPLLQNVTILATGSRAIPEGDAKDGRRTYATITLETSPEDAQRVLAAREVGKLAALLRSPGDNASASGARRDAMALLGIGGLPRQGESDAVPVLYGGRNSAGHELNPGRLPAAVPVAPVAPVASAKPSP